jgi:hypothetical protein
MAKKEANRSAATLPRASGLSGPPGGAGFVSDYVSRTQVPAASEQIEAVQVCGRRLAEGYGYSKSDLLDLHGHADRYKQSVRVSATNASEFLEPAKVGRLQ